MTHDVKHKYKKKGGRIVRPHEADNWVLIETILLRKSDLKHHIVCGKRTRANQHFSEMAESGTTESLPKCSHKKLLSFHEIHKSAEFIVTWEEAR